jgi:hypothetical protein
MCNGICANFNSAQDKKLLDNLSEEVGKAYTIEHISCTLTIDKILKVHNKRLAKLEVRNFVELWFRACRALFSDESLSLRTVKTVISTFEQHEERTNGLAALLFSKMPNLGKFCCRKFTHHLLEYHMELQHDDDLLNRPPSIAEVSTPVKLLVRAALVTGQDMCTYIEYIEQQQNAYEMHPILRLKAWTKAVFDKMYSNSKSKNNPRTNPNRAFDERIIDCLDNLAVVDQVGFPLIKEEHRGDLSFDKCDTFARQGDYTDIKWLIETLKHK